MEWQLHTLMLHQSVLFYLIQLPIVDVCVCVCMCILVQSTHHINVEYTLPFNTLVLSICLSSLRLFNCFIVCKRLFGYTSVTFVCMCCLFRQFASYSFCIVRIQRQNACNLLIPIPVWHCCCIVGGRHMPQQLHNHVLSRFILIQIVEPVHCSPKKNE